jgi:hypothetical protein
MTTTTTDGRVLTEWRTIPEFPLYQITPDGDVRNRRTHKLLREWQNTTTGAYSYTLSRIDGRTTNRNWQTLVRQAWPENSA